MRPNYLISHLRAAQTRNATTLLEKNPIHLRPLHWLFVFVLCLGKIPAHAAFHYFNPTDSAAIPTRFSEVGFYANIPSKTPIPEAVAFEINAALWSDGAWKQRWIILPAGKSIPYDDTTDFFDYPDSTVFVKNFWLETREGDTTSRILWETRLLIKRATVDEPNQWHGFSYRWNASQSEATLVPPSAEFDTLLFYIDSRGQRTYKRWRYPSANCQVCHMSGRASNSLGHSGLARSVLGFYPAQLKRPGFQNRNQILNFFSKAVFSGTTPDSAQLSRRFIGIHEYVPYVPGSEAAIKTLDTQARSYLAANCSGCHGYRGIANGAIGDKKVNFDFYALTPAISFAHFPTQTFSLHDTTTYLPHQDPSGRAAYIDAVVMAGLDTSAGRVWNMKLPTFIGDPKESLTPALVYPGYPALTELLYRQVRRASAKMDSAILYRFYTTQSLGGDSTATQKLKWLFGMPWGSLEWESSLSQHGWTLDSVFAVTGQFSDGQYIWRRAPEQMPELASYLPDTAALQLLANWVRSYPTTGVRRSPRINPTVQPTVQSTVTGNTIYVPSHSNSLWTLSDLRGRTIPLKPIRPGLYHRPESLPVGTYFLRSGENTFKIALF